VLLHVIPLHTFATTLELPETNDRPALIKVLYLDSLPRQDNLQDRISHETIPHIVSMAFQMSSKALRDDTKDSNRILGTLRITSRIIEADAAAITTIDSRAWLETLIESLADVSDRANYRLLA